MRVLSRGTWMAEMGGCASNQEPAANTAFGSARTASLYGSLANLWPVTMIVVALGLTIAWSGLLMSLLWWGLEELI
jgi:hypothetical protein